MILKNAYLHRLAIYVGLKHEKISRLLEDMLLLMCSFLPKPDLSDKQIDTLISRTDMIMYQYDPIDYLYE